MMLDFVFNFLIMGLIYMFWVGMLVYMLVVI